METFTITTAHIDQHGRYIGPAPEFDGNVLIEAGLGCVHFRHLHARGSIVAKTGSSIKTVKGVSAGLYITVRASLDSGDDIKAGEDISVGASLDAAGDVEAAGDVTVGWSTTVAGNLTVVGDLKAGVYISAETISVGLGIEAGASLDAVDLTAGGRIKVGGRVTTSGLISAGGRVSAELGVEAGVTKGKKA